MCIYFEINSYCFLNGAIVCFNGGHYFLNGGAVF